MNKNTFNEILKDLIKKGSPPKVKPSDPKTKKEQPPKTPPPGFIAVG